MKVSILIDNSPHPMLDLCSEHGLSIYFEADGYKWLFDVGASGQFYANALKMGISIEDIDFLVISHGHSDHAGGLNTFLNHNAKARVILSSHIDGNTFYSYRKELKRNITMNYEPINTHSDRFVFTYANMELSKNVRLVYPSIHYYEKPKANATLFRQDTHDENPDTFKHEIALCINTPKGMVIFSGCAHNGLLNILSSCTEIYPNTPISACVGGTHLVDGFESPQNLEQIGESLIKHYPVMNLITGHCTGKDATKLLSETMKDKFKYFFTGDCFDL